ncbi:Lipoprotein-releasing system transmembrane protein LolE [Emticicia aquatica]|uniref:Lipoprotein-releasing system transmembrane protein LolE n=2 Tax=Emticicia aquatica TaxID=1681835 RepID=A0ABN8ER11_9BACT|nr:Lipoprotein-releasing system transmembrane protein LolE [Emticicia aquatica]
MLGIGIGTMALVIVLSVFNGLEDLNRKIFKSFDPDIRITAKEGKSFLLDKTKLEQIKAIKDIWYVTEVIQDNALVKYENAQMVVTLKGVDTTFQANSSLKKSLVEGDFVLTKDSVDYAFIGGNVYAALNISLQNVIEPLEIWYPRNKKTISLNPDDNINRQLINISGVYSLEQFHDDFVYVPIEVTKQLTEYGNRRSAIEVQMKPNVDIAKTQDKIRSILGEKYLIQNQDEQNATLFRAIKIEKLFIFIALVFIIGIASFNIFFSLTMLVIDKKQDLKTLFAMGADASLVKRIFFSEGALVSFIGAIVGLILGGIICFIQEKYGFVKMGMQSAIIDAYPVKMHVLDFILTAVAIIIITLLASYLPAKRAANNL